MAPWGVIAVLLAAAIAPADARERRFGMSFV